MAEMDGCCGPEDRKPDDMKVNEGALVERLVRKCHYLGLRATTCHMKRLVDFKLYAEEFKSLRHLFEDYSLLRQVVENDKTLRICDLGATEMKQGVFELTLNGKKFEEKEINTKVQQDNEDLLESYLKEVWANAPELRSNKGDLEFALQLADRMSTEENSLLHKGKGKGRKSYKDLVQLRPGDFHRLVHALRKKDVLYFNSCRLMKLRGVPDPAEGPRPVGQIRSPEKEQKENLQTEKPPQPVQPGVVMTNGNTKKVSKAAAAAVAKPAAKPVKVGPVMPELEGAHRGNSFCQDRDASSNSEVLPLSGLPEKPNAAAGWGTPQSQWDDAPCFHMPCLPGNSNSSTEQAQYHCQAAACGPFVEQMPDWSAMAPCPSWAPQNFYPAATASNHAFPMPHMTPPLQAPQHSGMMPMKAFNVIHTDQGPQVCIPLEEALKLLPGVLGVGVVTPGAAQLVPQEAQ